MFSVEALQVRGLVERGAHDQRRNNVGFERRIPGSASVSALSRSRVYVRRVGVLRRSALRMARGITLSARRTGLTQKIWIDGVDRTGTITNKTCLTTGMMTIGAGWLLSAYADFANATLDEVSL